MTTVLDFTDVSVVRPRHPPPRLRSGSDVEDDERGIVLRPERLGKTTLPQLAAANMHPSSGQVKLLFGEKLGDGSTSSISSP